MFTETKLPFKKKTYKYIVFTFKEPEDFLIEANIYDLVFTTVVYFYASFSNILQLIYLIAAGLHVCNILGFMGTVMNERDSKKAKIRSSLNWLVYTRIFIHTVNVCAVVALAVISIEDTAQEIFESPPEY